MEKIPENYSVFQEIAENVSQQIEELKKRMKGGRERLEVLEETLKKEKDITRRAQLMQSAEKWRSLLPTLEHNLALLEERHQTLAVYNKETDKLLKNSNPKVDQ